MSTAISPSRPPKAKFNFWRWFWLSTIPISLGWLWHDFYAPDNHVTWAKDYASAQQQATRTGKPIIVFFTGKWWSPCRIMKRNVWADSEVESKVNAGFAAVTVDVDDPQASDLVRRYRVGATPNTVITDPKGNVLQQVQGGIDRAHFLEMIASPKL
jgi:protein disulfide-isomerase